MAEHNHQELDKYRSVIAESNVVSDDAQVKAAVEKILAEHQAENMRDDVYQFLLNCVDLTTLSTEDSERSVAAFTKKVNDYWVKYPDYKNVAAICVYSNFAAVVRANLEVSDVNIAVCSASFPSSQAHLETKVAETALAIADGTDEECHCCRNRGKSERERKQSLRQSVQHNADDRHDVC